MFRAILRFSNSEDWLEHMYLQIVIKNSIQDKSLSEAVWHHVLIHTM